MSRKDRNRTLENSGVVDENCLERLENGCVLEKKVGSGKWYYWVDHRKNSGVEDLSDRNKPRVERTLRLCSEERKSS